VPFQTTITFPPGTQVRKFPRGRFFSQLVLQSETEYYAYFLCQQNFSVFDAIMGLGQFLSMILVRGVLGNKCAGHHNLKRVKIREIM
jgi:hypothetical protein